VQPNGIVGFKDITRSNNLSQKNNLIAPRNRCLGTLYKKFISTRSAILLDKGFGWFWLH